jgi:hypothetical protein
MIRILIFILSLFLVSISAKSQILTNNGAIFSAQPSAIVWVNGGVEVVNTGEFAFENNALLQCGGDFRAGSGLVVFRGASIGVVIGDFFLDLPATLSRLGSGKLSILRHFYVKGLVENDGEIEIGMP